jgi:hypothetical protein|tara:strand:- start:344 stop:973 length:630 start_codon:yes stop_codon:yes gene_type:complete
MEHALRGQYKQWTMTPYQVYTKYIALKNHFTLKNYDYFTYGGKVRAKQSTFEVRKDKYFFYKLSKHKDVENFLLANLLDGGKDFWVGTMRDSGPEEIYREWKKRQESLTYTFKNDLTKLNDDFDSNFRDEKYGHPHLLRLYLRGDVCIETMCILDMLVNYSAQWNKFLEKDLIWSDKYTIIKKYKPFLSIKTDKMKAITLEYFDYDKSE